VTYPNPTWGGDEPPGGYGPPISSGRLPDRVEQPLLTIGNISVSQNWVVVPTGFYKLRGTNWTVQDSTQVTETIPVYAIVLAVIFFFVCLLGLLFLLIKERRYTGFIAVTVVGEGLFHSVQLPPGPQNAAWATHEVNRARALAAMAR
jgi:hypothetical protein